MAGELLWSPEDEEAVLCDIRWPSEPSEPWHSRMVTDIQALAGTRQIRMPGGL